MSLVPNWWDNTGYGGYNGGNGALYHPRHHRYSQLTPWATSGGGGLLDDVFDSTLREMHELERQMGRVSQTDSGDFNWQCNVTGYRPEELEVNLDGSELLVRGEHRDAREGETVFRKFERRITLPEGVNKDQVRADIDQRGRLHINVPRPAIEEQRQSIPIGYRQAAVEPRKEDQRQQLHIGQGQDQGQKATDAKQQQATR